MGVGGGGTTLLKNLENYERVMHKFKTFFGKWVYGNQTHENIQHKIIIHTPPKNLC
jgi:hypothetical protein